MRPLGEPGPHTQRANRPIKTINEIVQGKAEITADTGIQLERVLGVPASLWQSLERNYRESLARARDRQELERHVDRLGEIPVSAMEKLGWIPHGPNKVEKLSNVLAFFGVASVEALERRADARFRTSRAFQANPIAVGHGSEGGISRLRRSTVMPGMPPASRRFSRRRRPSPRRCPRTSPRA